MVTRLDQCCAALTAFACGLALTGCSFEPTTTKSAAKLVVLSINDDLSGPIQGAVQCKDEKGRFVMRPQCLGLDDVVMDAVFRCGPSKVTVDHSWTHTMFVSFPTNWAPGNPSNLDVVKCIQRSVGFSFSAAIASATEPGEFPDEGDDAPFSTLHSRKQP